MSYNDEQIRKAVENVFQRYDKDKNGSLDQSEVTQLINDALKQMNQNRKVTQQEVETFISAVDKNKDKKIEKDELIVIFKSIVLGGQQSQKKH